MSIQERHDKISNFHLPEIKDFPYRPIKTIILSIFLLFSGILFVGNGVDKWNSHESTWDEWFGFFVLGGLLLCPGVYYSFYLMMILIGVEGYEYKDLPDLSDSS